MPSFKIVVFRQFWEGFSRSKAHWRDSVYMKRKCFIAWWWFPRQKFPDAEDTETKFPEKGDWWTGKEEGYRQDIWIWDAKTNERLKYQVIFAKNLKATSSPIDGLTVIAQEKHAKKEGWKDFLYS